MSKFDLILEDKDISFYLLKFNESICKLDFIKSSDNYIEFPELVIFSKRNETIRQLLNPSIDVLSVSEEDISLMIQEIEKLNFFKISSFLKPKGDLYFNIDKIKEDLILYKENKYFIIVNDMLFTTDSLEFHGSFLGGKNKYFLVSKEELEELKTIFREAI